MLKTEKHAPLSAERPAWRRSRLIIWVFAVSLTATITYHIASPKAFFWPLKGKDTIVRLSEDHDSTENSSQFQLKHIFHHGTGPSNYRFHQRLDVTPAYLEEYGTQLEQMHVQEMEFRLLNAADSADLEAIHCQYDWPQSMGHVSPWQALHTLKAAESKGRSVRLKERHTEGFLDSYMAHAMSVKGDPRELDKIHLEWQDEEISLPNLTDKDTMISLALMLSNAYVRLPESDEEKRKLDWTDVGGWEPNEDDQDLNYGWQDTGLRGHIFVANDLKTVVIAIKGTSGAVFPGGRDDETSENDKLNDNLLFLCCCARVGYLWTTVCDCYEKTYTCNQDCLEKELLRKDRYYQAALDIYRNVTRLYDPAKTDIWVTGHSLGGALASLVGRTYGLPAVTFEAPGEMLATKRLHLPQPPGLPKYRENIWHVGNTADPIYMGVCNGASSTCNAAGYAMETACHTGKMCAYDVVTDKGWRINLLNHRIHTVIDDIIMQYNTTAECVDQPPCRDCFNWRFTTHDDEIPDEPKLPNPLKPRPKSSSSTRSRSFRSKTSSWATKTSSRASSTSKSTNLASAPPEETPKKCLERTWYGWCTKWGNDGDLEGPEGI